MTCAASLSCMHYIHDIRMENPSGRIWLKHHQL